MIILAIDPGNEKSAYVSYDCADGKIFQFGIADNQHIRGILRTSFFDDVVIEMIASYGMPVGATVFETCLWIGRFIEMVAPRKHTLVYRKDIKLHLCGTPRAKDGNIRQALIDKIGPQGVKKKPGPTYGISKDVWSALAVAIYYKESCHKEG
jgi:hypothetical protein